MKLFYYIGLLILLPLTSQAQSIKDIKWSTEEFPPYNYSENGKITGLSTEVVIAIVKKFDPNIANKIKVLPWARGYKSIQKDNGSALYSTTHTETRDKLFKWVGPIAVNKSAIIVKKDSNIKINSNADLVKYKFGVVRDAVGDQNIVEAGVPDNMIERASNFKFNIKKLQAGRLDAVVYNPVVANWVMKSIGINPNDFKTIYTLDEKPLSIAFHKNTDDKIIKTLQESLDELKKSGEYDKIVKKY